MKLTRPKCGAVITNIVIEANKTLMMSVVVIVCKDRFVFLVQAQHEIRFVPLGASFINCLGCAVCAFWIMQVF